MHAGWNIVTMDTSSEPGGPRDWGGGGMIASQIDSNLDVIYPPNSC